MWTNIWGGLVLAFAFLCCVSAHCMCKLTIIFDELWYSRFPVRHLFIPAEAEHWSTRYINFLALNLFPVLLYCICVRVCTFVSVCTSGWQCLGTRVDALVDAASLPLLFSILFFRQGEAPRIPLSPSPWHWIRGLLCWGFCFVVIFWHECWGFILSWQALYWLNHLSSSSLFI